MEFKETDFLKPGIDTKIADSEHIYMISEQKVLSLQVCTTIPPDDGEELGKLSKQLNADYPAGTSAGWAIEMEGPVGPVKCADVEGRYHYIFNA